MKIKTLLNAAVPQSGKDHDVVLRTSASVHRNMAGWNFPSKSREADSRQIAAMAESALVKTRLFQRKALIHLDDCDQTDKRFLSETGRLPAPIIADARHKYIRQSKTPGLSATINIQDHFVFSAVCSGSAPSWTLDAAAKCARLTGEHAAYAFSREFGYLTSSPRYAGTGIRIAATLCLGGLVRTGRLHGALAAASRMKLECSALNGAEQGATGDFYTISTAVSTGLGESDIEAGFSRGIQLFVNAERTAREWLNGPERRLKTADDAWRAVGLMRHARILSYEEFLRLLSPVFIAGDETPVSPKLAGNMVYELQAGHINIRYGKKLSMSEREIKRAELARELFSAQNASDDSESSIQAS